MDFNRFKRRVCFDSMHIDHPNISGLISDSKSVTYASEEVGEALRYLVEPCHECISCIKAIVSGEESRSVDKYDILYSLQVPHRFIS